MREQEGSEEMVVTLKEMEELEVLVQPKEMVAVCRRRYCKRCRRR